MADMDALIAKFREHILQTVDAGSEMLANESLGRALRDLKDGYAVCLQNGRWCYGRPHAADVCNWDDLQVGDTPEEVFA